MTSHPASLLVAAVVVEIVVLALPGVPTVERSGYVLCAALVVLAGLAPVRRWALQTLAVVQGVLSLGAVVAALGPTRNVQLGLFAAAALATEALALRALRQGRAFAPSR